VIGGQNAKTPIKTVEPLRPPETEKIEQKPAEQTTWPKKPKTVQAVAGRIEFSVPWQIMILAVLLVVALIFGAFRFGRLYDIIINNADAQNASTASNTPQENAPDASQQPPIVQTRTNGLPPAGLVTSNKTPLNSDAKTKSNVIVLAQYADTKQLLPVQQHFAKFGVQTNIVKSGSVYKLITKNTYDNPNKSGTDGFAAKQNIKQIGAQYKPPEGFKSFDFSSVYGEKVK
jgi:hypothetical protein